MRALQVALDCGCSQKLPDPFCFVESFVDTKPDFRSKFEVNAPGNFAAHVALVVFQRREHFFFIASAERRNVDRGKPQIGAHPHLGHRDHMRFDDGIMDIAAHKHFGQRVTNEFADAQLARRTACRLITMVVAMTCHCFR